MNTLDDAVIVATAQRPKEVDGPDAKGSWIPAWLEIGRANPWIQGAFDPPFNEDSFECCATFYQLSRRMLHVHWCVGQAFWLFDEKPLCFIQQQIDGGNEWLVIRGGIPFESFTTTDANSLRAFIQRVNNATDEQLRDPGSY